MQDVCRARSKTEGAVRAHFDNVHNAVAWAVRENRWNPDEDLPDGFFGNGDEKPVVTRQHVPSSLVLVDMAYSVIEFLLYKDYVLTVLTSMNTMTLLFIYFSFFQDLS